MAVPQNAGAAWQYVWQPRNRYTADAGNAQPAYKTVMRHGDKRLTKSRFNDNYYVREDSGNTWLLGSFENANAAAKAFGKWHKCHSKQ